MGHDGLSLVLVDEGSEISVFRCYGYDQAYSTASSRPPASIVPRRQRHKNSSYRTWASSVFFLFGSSRPTTLLNARKVYIQTVQEHYLKVPHRVKSREIG